MRGDLATISSGPSNSFTSLSVEKIPNGMLSIVKCSIIALFSLNLFVVLSNRTRPQTVGSNKTALCGAEADSDSDVG